MDRNDDHAAPSNRIQSTGGGRRRRSVLVLDGVSGAVQMLAHSTHRKLLRINSRRLASIHVNRAYRLSLLRCLDCYFTIRGETVDPFGARPGST